jgi:hypothetical protein
MNVDDVYGTLYRYTVINRIPLIVVYLMPIKLNKNFSFQFNLVLEMVSLILPDFALPLPVQPLAQGPK